MASPKISASLSKRKGPGGTSDFLITSSAMRRPMRRTAAWDFCRAKKNWYQNVTISNVTTLCVCLTIYAEAPKSTQSELSFLYWEVNFTCQSELSFLLVHIFSPPFSDSKTMNLEIHPNSALISGKIQPHL